MSTTTVSPDRTVFLAHLAGGRFRAGVAAGRWRLISCDWPILVVGVLAARRENGPAEFVLRFDCTGYPNDAPTGGLWDLEEGVSLPADRRPKGERAAQLFRFDGWMGGATAMYAPWDRVGLQAHPEWANQYPATAWHPARDFSFVLANVHETLNAADYAGV